MRGEILWRPPHDVLQRSRIGAYLHWLDETRGLRFTEYAELWRWSVDDLDAFWRSIAEWVGVRWHDQPDVALADASMPGTRWFPGSTLNYAEHALGASATRGDDIAVIARSQTRAETQLTWTQLTDAVARCRAGLLRLGVGRGDRVVAYAPNVPETLIAFLAAASLGAVWSSCAPEFGTRGHRSLRADRTGSVARDRRIPLRREGGRSTRRRRHHRGRAPDPAPHRPSSLSRHRARRLDRSARGGSTARLRGAPVRPSALRAVQLGHDGAPQRRSCTGTAASPWSTRRPSCSITTSVRDRFCWFTTTGWMMWNYLISGLLVGATVVLFDGDPGHPDLSTLWQLASETDLDVLGVSAPFLMSCRKTGIAPPAHRLRSVGSTGSPLPADGFRWVHDAVGADVQLASVSGGTDVCAAFVGAVPLLPVRAARSVAACSGARSRRSTPTARCARPAPRASWWSRVRCRRCRSASGATPTVRSCAAYFSDYPGVWRHGDWITFTDDGACVISGRSDATLNRGGVRLGTSDFYAVVEGLPEVADSLVVHLEGADDDAMGELVLFVKLADGATLDDDLVARLRNALRRELSPRHVPDAIHSVPAVPRTLSGKKLEVPVKRILGGAAAIRWQAAAHSPNRNRFRSSRTSRGSSVAGTRIVLAASGHAPDLGTPSHEGKTSAGFGNPMMWTLTVAAVILLPVEMAAIVFAFRRHGDDIERWLDEKRWSIRARWNLRRTPSTSPIEPRPVTDAT